MVNPLTDARFAAGQPRNAVASDAAPVVDSLVHEFEVDQVRCFWAPGHGAMSVGVVFGVGEADERIGQRGLTSLVAELALRAVGTRVEHRWSVGAQHTILEASGPHVEMDSFVRSVVRSLSSLPLGQIAEASESLLATSLECDGVACHDARSVLYGFEGPGAAQIPPYGLLTADSRTVAEWARKFFVRENAAAFFFGPRPEAQSFSGLASGSRSARVPVPSPPNRPPTLHYSACDGPGFFAPIRTGHSSVMIVEVARKRLVRALVKVVGHDCAVDVLLTHVDEKTSWLTVSSTAGADEHQLVLDVTGDELRRLGAEGPSSQEIDTYFEKMDRLHSELDGNVSLSEARSHARAAARGETHVSYPKFRNSIGKASATGLSLPLLRSLPTGIWVLPEGSPADGAGMQRVPLTGRAFATSAGRDQRPDNVSLIDGSLVLRYGGEQQPVVVSDSDVVGVICLPSGDVDLYTRSGCVLSTRLGGPESTGIASFLAQLPDGIAVPMPRRLQFDFDVAEDLVDEPGQGAVAPETEPDAIASELAPGNVGQDSTAAQNSTAGQNSTAAQDDASSEDEAESKRRRGFRVRAAAGSGLVGKAARSQGPTGPAVPGDEVTYCYPSATAFAEAIVAGEWGRVETLFDEAGSPDTQAHFVHVASHTGGDPARFDPWVSARVSAGLARTIRGAVRLRGSWHDHVESGGKQSSKESKRLLHEFEVAEADLVLATVELGDSPVPWVPLLEVTRILGRPRDVAEGRYVSHVERGALLAGHLEFQQCVSKRWSGSHREMWEHVEFVCGGAAEGSAVLAVAPMAFIEQWLDECLAGTDQPDASTLLRVGGFEDIIGHAVGRSCGSPSFDLLSPASAKALEIFFTYFWSVGDFGSAAALSKKMGKRFSGHPMSYFNTDSWVTIRAVAERLAASAG